MVMLRSPWGAKPTKQQLLAHEGLVLLHFGLSNCSQRVRVCLFEKRLNWINLHLNLMVNVHATPWYQAINPKGLVPTLIHDGRIITESLEIIRYLEQFAPEKPLIPKSGEKQLQLNNILAEADAVQAAVKLLSHVFLFKIQRPIARLFMPRFGKYHQNEELVEFRHRFINDDFSESEIHDALTQVHSALLLLERSIEASGGPQQWILGESFSLADIAWIVNIHRFDLMGFPLQHYPALRAWYRRCITRESVKRGLVDFEPKIVLYLLKLVKIFSRSRHDKYLSVDAMSVDAHHQ